MPALFDLGMSPGQALAAPTTASVSNGMVLSAGGVWVYPPGYLLAHNTGTSVDTTTTQGSLLSGGAISGAFPAFVAAGDKVHILAAGYYSIAGTSSTFQFDLYFAGTNIGSVTNTAPTGTTERMWTLDISVMYLTSGAPGTVIPVGYIVAKTAASASAAGFYTAGASTNDIFWGSGRSYSVTNNAAGSFDLKSTASTSTATHNTCTICQVRYYPKGY